MHIAKDNNDVDEFVEGNETNMQIIFGDVSKKYFDGCAGAYTVDGFKISATHQSQLHE